MADLTPTEIRNFIYTDDSESSQQNVLLMTRALLEILEEEPKLQTVTDTYDLVYKHLKERADKGRDPQGRFALINKLEDEFTLGYALNLARGALGLAQVPNSAIFTINVLDGAPESPDL